MKTGKVVLIVLDGVGVGAQSDAAEYGDERANTLGNTAKAIGSLHLPHLQRLGIGQLTDVAGLKKEDAADGGFGKLEERSAGKDSTTGHWELAGLITRKAFPLYPRGFPEDVLANFLTACDCRGYLGNKPASGTEIIQELGDEHVKTGFPIVYTSGDSVFQIAAHEDVIPLERLYEICSITRREVMVDAHAVGRIIARPFIGASGSYVRTTHRRDFALEPHGTTVLDLLFHAGFETIGIGKIDDLFSGRGLKEKIHTSSNSEGVKVTIDAASRLQQGIVMTNLVDFDTLYGHRQDARGMGLALEQFDSDLPSILAVLGEGDLMMLTADHGNDPADESTDHSREYVPLLCLLKGGRKNVNLGVRSSFADVGKTIADYFSLQQKDALAGNSFLHDLV